MVMLFHLVTKLSNQHLNLSLDSFLCCRFNSVNFSRMLPKDAVFVGTIRDPLAQLKSRFRQFNLARMYNIPKRADPVKVFLQQPEVFEEKRQRIEKKRGRNVFSTTRNFLLFQYGADEHRMTDAKYVKGYIKYLEREFHFIAGMIVNSVIQLQ